MRPNILFVIPDQWRADWTALNESLPIRTPSLLRLCSEGARFSCAISPSPLCAPARAALASGMEYDRCGVADNRHNYPIDQPTFYGVLRDAGYHVMGCGKFDLAKADFGWKLDGSSRLREWGFHEGIDCEGKWDAVTSGRAEPAGPYMAFLEGRGLRQIHLDDMRRREVANPFGTWPTPLPEDAYADNWVAAHALRLICGAPSNRPWFLQVNFLGPHDPWDVTVAMADLYRDQEFDVPAGVSPKDREVHNAVRRNYAAMIENIDRWIGVVLNKLELSGQLANTLVVVSSDHGEMLGDRGIWGKSVPFQPSVEVPLVIAGPGVSAGTVISTPTTILDLAATFADFSGATVIPGWDSRSLRRQLADPDAPPPRSHVFSALPQWRSVFDGRYKLVAFHDRITLRDLKTDPNETIDIAASNPEIVERLSTLLREHAARTTAR